MLKSLSIIGVPSSAGAYAPGQEKTPQAIRNSGLVTMLLKKGINVKDLGDLEGFRWQPDFKNPSAMNIEQVVSVIEKTSKKVKEALLNDTLVFVIGGDCSIELGTVSGATSVYEHVGLIYIDFDVDLQTPNSTQDGALDWMGVAHLLDIKDTDSRLSSIGPKKPLLLPEDVLLFMAGNIKPNEEEIIRLLNIKVEFAKDVITDPFQYGVKAARWGEQFDKLLVHLDVDVLNFGQMPLAENSRREGVSFESLLESLRGIATASNFLGLTLTEVNPDHGPENGSALYQLTESLVEIFGTVPQLTGAKES